MNKALLSLAVAGLALSAAQASFAQKSKAPVVQSDVFNLIPINQVANIPLQEAYRLQGTINSTATQMCPGFGTFARNVGFTGGGVPQSGPHYPISLYGSNIDNACTAIALNGTIQSGPELVTAVPGIFALASANKGSNDLRQRLNCNAFATCAAPNLVGGFTNIPSNAFGSPFVQSCRLIKNIPTQPKCPGVFPGASFIQFGAQGATGGIRTWWALKFTPPGTQFILQVTTRCLGAPGTKFFGQTSIHIDQYTFEVCVTPESLLALIDVFHSEAIGTSEIPCIASEDVYLALRLAIARIACQCDQNTAQNKLFEAEALVVAFCAFGDCFVAEDFFSTFNPATGQFPGNDVDINGAFGPTGILDTIENPCCCKLLVDLDNLGNTFVVPCFGGTILSSTTGDP